MCVYVRERERKRGRELVIVFAAYRKQKSAEAGMVVKI